MSLRSGGRKVSFDLLASDSSGDDGILSLRPSVVFSNGGEDGRSTRRKRKSKASKKKKLTERAALAEDRGLLVGLDLQKPVVENGHYEDKMGLSVSKSRSVVESVCENTVVEPAPEPESSQVSCVSFVELRQRNANGSAGDEPGEEETSTRESSAGQWRPQSKEKITKFAKEGSLDWNRVMAEDPNLLGEVSSSDRSPIKYFMGEIYGGNSLRSTIPAGNEKKRQGVYNTMFHVPWRCERLIVAGFFVCLDSFLSLLTIMPARILMTIWRVLHTRQFQRPNAAELSDFGCFIVLTIGVITLQMTDISLIYHIIRGQGIVKLYVVYNVLEIFDKLCQSFGEDVLQVLFNSAEGLSNCLPDNMIFQLMRFILDEAIAIIAFVVHSFILLAQAITLSTCIIGHNNALLALLVSNNFSEVKSSVFKRVSKENLHSLVYYDIIERFHITTYVLFVLSQNILEAEGPWFESFAIDALQVYVCETFIDTIKHSFLAKFNEIKPSAYSEFLEDLCKQTLNEKPDERRKDLTFIPLAPASVVIRVLTPVYAIVLPYGPLPWRLFWIIFWSSLTYITLAICKMLVGLSLRRLATWYMNQQLESKQHVD
ncbi:protein POLLEN DEFECTIVE IN GUIDANCE 1-like isoform X2 [Phoenix dactylifera]|uniref:Protein POLLEN DEFECTIVE IN GUIDANCE 1-like isoform X2 n=1 Tax=Phoenix dactylifera TaxID=42345 RepID=A0A8B7D2N7_PHODC|nr:protein POLLEN DEFECTIVE IN GUIDANCE 1-like isoform X2 [Phoenix dactylifera]